KTLGIMTSDQLPPHTPRVTQFEIGQDLDPVPELGQSFGLGVAVPTEAGHSPVRGSVGEYFWAGAARAHLLVWPKQKLFDLLMLQMDFVQAGRYRRALRELVYGALIP